MDVLIEMFQDRVHDEIYGDEPDFEAIEAAIWALTEIGDIRALDAIIQIIFEHYHDGSILTNWGEPAFHLLMNELKNNNESKRADAASLLGEFGDPKAVPQLIELLNNDESDDVRHSVAYALSELRDPRAVDALIHALDDPYDETRVYATIGLGHLKDLRAVDALKKATQDENARVRHCAKQAVENLLSSSTD